jgi:hypothetical protein
MCSSVPDRQLLTAVPMTGGPGVEYFWKRFFTIKGLDTPHLDHQTLFA